MATRIHPLTGAPATNGKPRESVVRALSGPQRQTGRRVHATYDAARDGDQLKNYWANADQFDADSANSRAVREKLVPRSRYEIGNNGYSDGIAQTYATDLVGVGPTLRMQSGSTGFNQLVESEWQRWSKAVKLRRKLWCQAHAKHQDGEGFGVGRSNPGVRHPVQLDYVLYETEQFQTPMLPVDQLGYIDGIQFDRYGNPEWYDLLLEHPGASYGAGLDPIPERVAARFVMHWFMLRRPGQHRGIPETASTLNTGAASRRWREATVICAETAAATSMYLKTQLPPDATEEFDAGTTMDVNHNMLTALPGGWDVFQMKSEHPNATYEAFHKSQISEQARPKSMPYNKAACDSSSYNFASGRLDHQTYYGALDVDRADGADLVLTPLFLIWFEEAVRVFGWLGGNPAAIGPAAVAHAWDWPKHFAADIKAEALSNEIKLKTGQTTLSRLYSASGLDFEDELIVMARDYGVSVDEMRAVLRNSTFDVQPAAAPANNNRGSQDDDEEE